MYHHRWMTIGFLSIAAIVPLPSTGWGDEAEKKPLCPICLAANKNTATYAEKAGNTLVRGVLNFGLGWTEFILQPAHEVKSGGNVATGIAKGLGQGVMRTLGGLGEVLTFWTPKMGEDYLHFTQNCPLDANP